MKTVTNSRCSTSLSWACAPIWKTSNKVAKFPKLSHEEQLRIKMRKSWGAAKDEESKEEQRAKLIRRIVLGVFVVFLFYFIFCTPLMQNVIGGLFGK